MAPRLTIRSAFAVTLVVLATTPVVVGAEPKVKKHGGNRHHVVGGDQGWDATSDLAKWSLHRVFMVGDSIWFTYSAAADGIAELRSKEEFESCDVSNPIRMYTSGLDRVTLDGEGPRYFISGKSESCKDGLKLHLNVLPKSMDQDQKVDSASLEHVSRLAEPPSSSSTDGVCAQSSLWVIGLAMLFLLSF